MYECLKGQCHEIFDPFLTPYEQWFDEFFSFRVFAKIFEKNGNTESIVKSHDRLLAVNLKVNRLKHWQRKSDFRVLWVMGIRFPMSKDQLEAPDIDPYTSRILSERSTMWATPLI